MSQVEPLENVVKPIISAPELNYATYHLDRSEYRYLWTPQQNGQSQITIAVGGGNQTIIEIPPGFYNLSRSYLTFYTNIAADGAGYNNQNIVGLPMVRDILIQGKKTQEQIGQYRYVNKYLSAILRRETPLAEVMSLDTPITSTATPPTEAYGVFEGLTLGFTSSTTGAARPTGAAASLQIAPNSNQEPTYLLPSAITTAQTLQWRVPLGIIKNSFLALDKTLYFPESLYIKITWDTALSAYFVNTNLTAPATGKASAATAYTLNNFGLQLCQEENVAIQNKLREEVEGGGLRILIDSIESSVVGLTGTQHSLVNRYNSVYGGLLKKFYWVPMNSGDNASNLFYDCDNTAAAKVLTFYAQVDNKRLNKANYNEANGDSFYECRDKLKGSCISSMNQYYYNFCYLIDFTNNYNLLTTPANPPTQNFQDGLDLSQEKRLDIYATTSGSLNHYTFAVIQRQLMITKDGLFMR